MIKKSKKPITLVDIARETNTSISTVSRVLSGSNYPVSEEKKKAIIKAAKDMDYHPNMIGKMLSTNNMPYIGVVIPSFQNPYYTQLIMGIEKNATDRGYCMLTFCSQRDIERERNILNILRINQIKGLLISSVDDSPRALNDYIDAGGKVCLFESNYPPMSNVINARMDQLEAGFTATNYLISQGHRKIAFLSTPLTRASRKHTFDGYKLALTDNNVSYSEDDLFTVEYELESSNDLYELEAGRKLAKEFLKTFKKKHYTAIVAINDLISYGIIQELKSNGINIPEDVSIISFDNLPYSALIDPPLTTMSVAANLLGQRACRLIIDYLHNDDPVNGITISVNADLVIRKSVAKIND